MSLIIDAIKKAQQLRMRDLKETPFFRAPGPKGGKGPFGRKYLWISSISGLAILLFAFSLGGKLLPLWISQPSQNVASMEKKEPVSHTVALNEFKPPQKEGLASLQKEKTDPSVKGTSTTLLSDPSLDKTSSPPQIEESPPKFAPAKRERAKGHSAGAPKKQTSVGPLPEPFSSSPSAVPLRKEVSTESIGVKNESVKDHSGTSETLTQFNLGIQFYQQRELLKAIQAYQKVIELDPSHSEAYNNLGTLYQELGDLDRAFQAYQKSIEVNPRYDKAFNNLGTLLFLKERYEESIEAFQKALAINSNNIESHINLGVLFKKQGQFDRAIEYYQKAITLNPLNGEIHYNIGLLYEQLEKVDLAITHYQTFIQLSSKTHPALVAKVQRHLNYLIKTKGKER